MDKNHVAEMVINAGAIDTAYMQGLIVGAILGCFGTCAGVIIGSLLI